MVSETEGKYSEGIQLGMFLGRNYIVTLHGKPIPQLNDILADIESGRPQLVEGSPSFLLYIILDMVVDNLEDAVRKAEETESYVGDEVLKEPPPENVLKLIYVNRGNLLLVRRLLRPQSDVVSRLIRGDFYLVDKRAELFIRDIYDHTLRTLDRIDTLLDINLGSLNIHGSSTGSRMNETMRLLTVISTIGVPLTILVGWYGMNFREMPEIYWTYGYLIVILIAIMMISGTILLFRKKGWF
jgi:magnesium transporter